MNNPMLIPIVSIVDKTRAILFVDVANNPISMVVNGSKTTICVYDVNENEEVVIDTIPECIDMVYELINTACRISTNETKYSAYLKRIGYRK